MIRDFVLLGRVKRRLVEGTMPTSHAFAYFFIITAVDNMQLAVLQVTPAQPTPYTPVSVWGSMVLGVVFLFASYFLNGGSAGRDFLVRYFSISAVTAMWIALPFQSTLWLSRSNATLASSELFVPAFILFANAALFVFIAYNIRDVAIRAS